MLKESLRKAYGEALVEQGSEHSEIVALEADLGKSTMSCLFQDAYPERYLQMGIAEQNMASTAAGLALVGKIPFIHSFAVFSTGRAYDQIRSSICIPNLNVNICGSSCGLSDHGDGKTHQSIDDIALMRALPHMTVLAPVDAVETRKMVKAMAEAKGPSYIRMSRADLPVLSDEGTPYQIGDTPVMRDGKDVLVIANGVMVSIALEAAVMAEKEGISVKVVNLSTIKPFPKNAVLEHAKGMKGIISAEEHNIYGGIGSACAEALSEEKVSLQIMGIEDIFGTSAAQYDELLQKYGLTAEKLFERIVKANKEK
ncbi:MAG: transketolase C-terminal domain-containing protein [Sphaerochaetaceae bacterium]|nr:transketolase C-terminal domain-containing protein [Sphaerochaetaceae bacterium]